MTTRKSFLTTQADENFAAMIASVKVASHQLIYYFPHVVLLFMEHFRAYELAHYLGSYRTTFWNKSYILLKSKTRINLWSFVIIIFNECIFFIKCLKMWAGNNFVNHPLLNSSVQGFNIITLCPINLSQEDVTTGHIVKYSLFLCGLFYTTFIFNI